MTAWGGGGFGLKFVWPSKHFGPKRNYGPKIGSIGLELFEIWLLPKNLRWPPKIQDGRQNDEIFHFKCEANQILIS